MANAKTTKVASNKDDNDGIFDFGVGNIIGRSENLQKLFRLITMVAKSEATILVQGESGTGKELIANAIHYKSLRSNGPFIKVNCAALSDSLLESELFGYKKGAFTGAFQDKKGLFEMADRGTILLDEIGNMSLTGQVKLLRVLQEGEILPVGASLPIRINVRVLVTTNIVLADAVAEGTFRDDLFHRLQVVPLKAPPLRENKKEDIPLLAKHFMTKYSQKHHYPLKEIAPDTLEMLLQHDWPGNVRELENVIEHAIIMEQTDIIQPDSLPTRLFQEGEAKKTGLHDNLTLSEKMFLFQRQLILSALNEAGWKKKVAAKNLGIDQRNLNYFLNKHHITNPITRAKRGEKTQHNNT